MFGKILVTIYFMGFTQAVFVDQDNHNKDLNKGNAHAWQMINIYHTPKAFSYKYEPYAYPKYEFEYSVSDKKTGDHKHHHEARDGDRVRGEYSLVESDGSLRKVQYNADDHTGFNAVVSKTVNKHGDHAVSSTDHTRFFYPVGNGVKINHYFPGKNYHYQSLEQSVNSESIPVHEEKESVLVKSEEPKILVTDSGDNVALAEPKPVEEIGTTSKPDAMEAVPVQVVPAIVSMIPETTNNIKSNDELSLPLVEKTEDLLLKESSPTVEDQIAENEDQHLDSEVASSYYNSKFYYISY